MTSPVAPRGEPARPAELDEVTTARARARDPAACRALVLRYQRPVFALLSRLLGTRLRALVPDLAQETFLRVFRGLPAFVVDDRARLSTWILTIATRLAIDELRRAVRETPAANPLRREPAADCRTDASLETEEMVHAIERAFDTLPPEGRAALILRVEHELDYEEIARALGTEVGTVRSRLSRARAVIREALAEATR